MSDWNSKDDPRRDTRFDDSDGIAKTTWGWIAAAVFAVAVLAIAFGLGHAPGPSGTETASNQAPPPVTSPMGRPSTTPPPAATNPATPIVPTPNTPTQRGTAQP